MNFLKAVLFLSASLYAFPTCVPFKIHDTTATFYDHSRRLGLASVNAVTDTVDTLIVEKIINTGGITGGSNIIALTANGANYGMIMNVNSTTWGLGHSTTLGSPGSHGTTDLTWNTSGGVSVSGAFTAGQTTLTASGTSVLTLASGATDAELNLFASGASANSSRLGFYTSQGGGQIRLLNDAYSSATTVMSWTRSGQTVTGVSFPSSPVTYGAGALVINPNGDLLTGGYVSGSIGEFDSLFINGGDIVHSPFSNTTLFTGTIQANAMYQGGIPVATNGIYNLAPVLSPSNLYMDTIPNYTAYSVYIDSIGADTRDIYLPNTGAWPAGKPLTITMSDFYVGGAFNIHVNESGADYIEDGSDNGGGPITVYSLPKDVSYAMTGLTCTYSITMIHKSGSEKWQIIHTAVMPFSFPT